MKTLCVYSLLYCTVLHPHATHITAIHTYLFSGFGGAKSYKDRTQNTHQSKTVSDRYIRTAAAAAVAGT